MGRDCPRCYLAYTSVHYLREMEEGREPGLGKGEKEGGREERSQEGREGGAPSSLDVV